MKIKNPFLIACTVEQYAHNSRYKKYWQLGVYLAIILLCAYKVALSYGALVAFYSALAGATILAMIDVQLSTKSSSLISTINKPLSPQSTHPFSTEPLSIEQLDSSMWLINNQTAQLHHVQLQWFKQEVFLQFSPFSSHTPKQQDLINVIIWRDTVDPQTWRNLCVLAELFAKG